MNSVHIALSFKALENTTWQQPWCRSTLHLDTAMARLVQSLMNWWLSSYKPWYQVSYIWATTRKYHLMAKFFKLLCSKTLYLSIPHVVLVVRRFFVIVARGFLTMPVFHTFLWHFSLISVHIYWGFTTCACYYPLQANRYFSAAAANLSVLMYGNAITWIWQCQALLLCLC